MKKDIRELAGNATHDELLTCVQLLALSVVQHREKCGFVAFRNSMEELRSRANGNEKSGLFVQGKEVLEEALEIARVLATDPEPAPVAQEAANEPIVDNRKQLRINVMAPIKVLWSGESDPVDARLENISWGGAAFDVDKAKIDGGDILQIILPNTRGSSISIEARVLRTWDLPDGKGQGVATRFSSLSTRDEAELENILVLLAQSGDSDGQRNHARLTQRLDIQFDNDHEFHATLDDISAGGLGVTVPDPLQVGQSLQAVIGTLDGTRSLKLRARVVRQNTQKLGNVELYHAGLKFEHPSEELNELTNELIRQMATLKNTRTDRGTLGEADFEPPDVTDKWWT